MNGKPIVVVMPTEGGMWAWQFRARNGATLAASWHAFPTYDAAVKAWRRVASLAPDVVEWDSRPVRHVPAEPATENAT